jgi:lipoprotein-releasing system ATP-binding protein
MNKVILSCSQLSKTFTDVDRNIVVLRDVNLTVHENQTVAISGVSGSGKSTLLHLLGGLDAPTGGRIFWKGDNMLTFSERKKCRLRNKHLGFIYQFHHLLPEFTALENVAMPLLIGGIRTAPAKRRARELLKWVGLFEREQHRMAELSGGERQRVAIARALVNHPQCVLADEPTGNLDRETADQVFQVMMQLRKKFGTSFVIVTHDSNLAKNMQISYRLIDGCLE